MTLKIYAHVGDYDCDVNDLWRHFGAKIFAGTLLQ